MEVKPGYKSTDVGAIPEGWEVMPLGEHFSFKNGLNAPKEFFGYGTPIINYMDVFRRPRLRMEEILGRVDVDSRERRAYEVRRGDVFFTRTSETVEEIGVAAVMLDDAEETVFSGFVLRARPTDEALDDDFKAYCFAPRYFRRQVTARASYTTRALTNGRALSAALLAKPPLEEQRAIAATLSDMDALLDGLDRLIAKKHDLKHAAMQQLLTGQTRLPGFSGEWLVERLGELAEMRSGGTPLSSVPAYYDGEIPWVSISDMTSCGKVIDKTERRLSEVGLANSAAQMFPKATVLYAMYASLGECCIAGVPVCTSQAILGLRPNRRLDSEFLYYYLASLKSAVKALGQQGTQANLNKGMVQDIQLALPSLSEQVAIVAVLSDMDTELSALEERREKTRALKLGMVQELLTGRTRLT